jgi:hypothetical protein
MAFSFSLGARDPGSRARRGTLRTSRGTVETPVFMPVGTRATVTGIAPDELTRSGPRSSWPTPTTCSCGRGLTSFSAWEAFIPSCAGLAWS